MGNLAWNLYWRENRLNAFAIKNAMQNQLINKLQDTNGIAVKVVT
jgi:hypothetical protein